MKPNLLYSLATSACLFVGYSAAAIADTTIVSNGKSTFTIVIPAASPTSIKEAALELQKDIEIATNAKLPIRNDSESISGPYFSLGSTKQAQSANISSEKMVDESFRIATKANNVYIIGPDTPDGKRTAKGGTSNATANGVYTFLEDYLDVRWLMPGDIGRDVPPKSTFTLKDMDKVYLAPVFGMRYLSYAIRYANKSQYDKMQAWMTHQRQGGAIQPVKGMPNTYPDHSMMRTINLGYGGRGIRSADTAAVQKAYKEHPEWFAMNAKGERPAPVGVTSKLETTNPELVKWFAEQAIKHLKNSDDLTYSLSPSDGQGWSQSPESKALYDVYPPYALQTGKTNMSSLVAKWYHDIAKIVAKEYPKGRLTGLLYSRYLYPPTKVNVKLPSNFSPSIAPSEDYGYRLYRDDVQKYFHGVMNDWAKIVAGDWFYYDLPNHLGRQGRAVGESKRSAIEQFPGGTGIVQPVAPGIAKTIFPQLVKSHINGVFVYGKISWSEGAISNYVWAKMEWDPTLDPYELQKEWLHRAYGDAAGAVMEQFYDKLDGWFRDFYRQNVQANYWLTLETLNDIFGSHYPEMEQIFLQAKQQPMNDIQKKRLQLIEDNLIVLQWRLRNGNFLPSNFSSPLQRTDAQISEIITRDNPDFPTFPGITTRRRDRTKPYPLPWKVSFTKSTFTGKETALKGERVPHRFIIYAAKDGEVRMTPKSVDHGPFFVSYNVRNTQGEIIREGIFAKDHPVTFPVQAGENYEVLVPIRSMTALELHIENAALAKGKLQGDTLQLSAQKDAANYVFYSAGIKAVNVTENNGSVIFEYGNEARAISKWAHENNITNLLQNGNFDAPAKDAASTKSAVPEDWGLKGAPTGWYTWSDRNDIQFLVAEGRNGKAISLKNTAKGGVGDVIQNVPVQSGKRYLGEVWIKSGREGLSGNMDISLRFRQGKDWFKGDQRVRTTALATGEWQKVFVSAVVPKGADSIAFMLGGRGQNNNVIFDDAALYEVPESVVSP